MKSILTFVLGAVLAGGVVYLASSRKSEPQPVAVQTAAQTPVTQPGAQPPVITPAPAPAPVIEQPAPAAAESKPTPTGWRRRNEPPRKTRTEVASNNPSPARQPESASNPAPPASTQPPLAAAQAQANPAPTPQVAQSQPAPAPVREDPPPPPKPHSVTINSGTLLTVRLNESVSSDKNQPGDTVMATLDQPLIVDGFVIAERGSRVEARITESEKAGRVKGLSHIGLELVSLRTSDGQKVNVKTEAFAKQGPESKGSDATKIGVGAALGAAIGAIAGGGKGAAIGAAAGGGAGTGAVMVTRGKPAVIPVETRLSFRLRDPLTITERLH